MEVEDTMEIDAVVDAVKMENVITQSFTFSRPNIISPSNNVFACDRDPEDAFKISSDERNLFTFAAPVSLPQLDEIHNQPMCQSNLPEKQYKPKISRDTFKASGNIIPKAVKDTNVLEQFRRNSKTQVCKKNIENSLTCTNVPEQLLTKEAAQLYFENYGDVKITVRPKKQTIIVAFNNYDSALSAYNKIGEYMGKNFSVDWTKNIQKSSVKKKNVQKDSVSEFLKATDDEIKSELEAMTNLEYNLHNNDITRPNSEASIFGIRKNVSTASSKGIIKREKLVTRLEKKLSAIDKLESDNQISKSLPSATVEELLSIICQAAANSEDKYKILEARDRLMRLKQVKTHSLATAKATSGTCPDMCPEKERLMRESQRQVAPYEQAASAEYRINHMTAVKQYSRSSADQEEPMSHELRPVKSLKMTMSYLLHEIVNLCEVEGTNLGEWYHFLWDRTRGIRKDITQQELCCVDSVELVEQCARFHIVCSERLCAEELSVFDKKINSENLTKCLQTLKYMYHDLRAKGIECRNEPEFRAYIILLNLNNGNFMWDLQRLPLCIQKSEDIRFAIQVYSALESNNYYRFFQLVRSTTYLNACILLRYFNQVRERALLVMIKAYNRTASTAYPLYELIDILGFEDEDEATYFCESFGLTVSNDKLYIMLNKRDFQEDRPIAKIEQGRAHNMVELKRIGLKLSIGECIAGGKMPEQTYKNHRPHNSFNSLGYLMQESINAEDQNSLAEYIGDADPYELSEEENLMSLRKHCQLVQEKQQNEKSRDSQVKMISLNKNDPSLIKVNATSVVEPKSKGIIDKASITNTFSFKMPHSAQSINDSEKKLNATSTNTIFGASNPFNSKAHLFGTKSSESFQNSGIQSEILSSNVASSKTQSELTSNFNNHSTFAMALNKSIFSGGGRENLFLKHSTVPSTIFSNYSAKENTPAQDTIAKNNENVQVKKSDKESAEDAEKKKLEAIKQDEQRIMNIEKSVSQIFNNLEDQVIQDLCSTLVKEQLDDFSIYDSLSASIMDKMMQDVTTELCRQLLEEELAIKERLYKISKNIENRLIVKYFNLWREHVIQEKWHQIKALESTPVWLQSLSLDERAKSLYRPNQKIVVRNTQSKQEERKSVEKRLLKCATPIEAIVYSGIRENLKSLSTGRSLANLFWKLVISWPDLENKPIIWQQKKLMNSYLSPEDYTAEPIVKTYRPNSYETLHISIRYFEGLISEHHLIGADALLFIAAATEDFQLVIRRLVKTILSRDKLMPMPVVLIVLGYGNLEIHRKEIVSNLEVLLEAGYISVYTIAFEQSLTDQTSLDLIQSAALWLATNKSPAIPLEMEYLVNVCDTCLTEELWLRIMGHSAFNKNLSRAMEVPNFIINLHNEAVMYLIEILLDSESLLYTKFPPEFQRFLKNEYSLPCNYEYFSGDWKTEEYRVKVESIMNTLIMPHWSFNWPITDTSVLHRNVVSYCQTTLADSNSNAEFSDILSHLFLKLGNLNVTWFADILTYIIKKKIQLFDENLTVVYNKNHIRHFRTLPWWFKSNALADISLQDRRNTNDNSEKSIIDFEPVVKRHKRSQEIESNEISRGEMSTLAEFCDETKLQIMQVHCTSEAIEKYIKSQKLQSKLLESKLQAALLNESESMLE